MAKLRTGGALLTLVLGALLGCGGSSSGSKCADLETAYATALSEARTCDPAARDGCRATRPDALDDVCRCQVAVDPASVAPLDQLLDEFQSDECAFAESVCNRLCALPAERCAPSSTGPGCE